MMTVYELRQLLFDVKDQGAKVTINGDDIRGIETAYNSTLVRILPKASLPTWEEI
jgi:hypothetical protein